MNKVVKNIDRKTTRLVLAWGHKQINLCKIGFTSDNSLIFSSAFHNDKIRGLNLELGDSKLLRDKFICQKATDFTNNPDGIHVFLHPKGQSVHIRKNKNGSILFSRKIEWFPVVKPFNLARLFSAPLDLCPTTSVSSPFFIPVSGSYKDSIEIKIDIFPRSITEYHNYLDSIWSFWGVCPSYFVRVSFLLAKQRMPALLFVVDDNKLSL